MCDEKCRAADGKNEKGFSINIKRIQFIIFFQSTDTFHNESWMRDGEEEKDEADDEKGTLLMHFITLLRQDDDDEYKWRKF